MTIVRRLGRREVLQLIFIPLGCDVNDEKNLPLVGAEVNVFAARILHTSRSKKPSLDFLCKFAILVQVFHDVNVTEGTETLYQLNFGISTSHTHHPN